MALPTYSAALAHGSVLLKDFRFQSGAVLPELRIHLRTLGDSRNPAVLALHATAGCAADLLKPEFGGALFGAGQPLDAARNFIILPDALGAGQSSKPSDGLRMQFPEYDYADMVHAQRRVLLEGLGITHLKWVIGHSMGGMHAWLWATQYADCVDAIVPLACVPSAMAGRNWMMRRFIVDSIRRDPAWQGGNYAVQPPSAQFASVYANVATSGGQAALLAAAPSAAAADAWLDAKLNASFAPDANDLIYQWQASRNYDPSPSLHRIQARVLAINAADDERLPPDSSDLSQMLAAIPRSHLHIIPVGLHSCGHATTASAAAWAGVLSNFMGGQN